jgi:hypothetical protein
MIAFISKFSGNWTIKNIPGYRQSIKLLDTINHTSLSTIFVEIFVAEQGTTFSG